MRNATNLLLREVIDVCVQGSLSTLGQHDQDTTTIVDERFKRVQLRSLSVSVEKVLGVLSWSFVPHCS